MGRAQGAYRSLPQGKTGGTEISAGSPQSPSQKVLLPKAQNGRQPGAVHAGQTEAGATGAARESPSRRSVQGRTSPRPEALRDAGTVITLAIAAHAATPKPVAFNSIFYTAVAGIIPVLFVALTVEGGTYKDLIKSITDATTPLAIIWREVIAGLILAAFFLHRYCAAFFSLQAGPAGGCQNFSGQAVADHPGVRRRRGTGRGVLHFQR